ncbi:peptidylprolyl isomerase [Psychrobacter phenylpyruvicus]|uniref:Chaperone SurA n=1 Tax=Psychrobacter phenylpyruvicus TaxID=29432 RepID=A0A379LK35_9GAMM|nr:peptidylprolyl isomerase [Psychrobacter phenylpyruvicus]SUD90247.1 Peptidyl-prolyl cis-trans isomerase surA [Psychrobacter phenylpyruvicus]
MTALNTQHYKSKHSCSHTKALDTSKFRLKKLTDALLVSTVLASLSLTAQAADKAADSATATQATEKVNPADVQAPISVSESSNGIIALVNDTPILKSELAAAIASAQMRIKASGQPAPSPQRLQSEVLNSLILRELQLDMVKRAGIRPSPDAVNESLARLAQAQGLKSLSELQQALDARQPGRYAAVRAQVIEEESLKALQQSQVANRVRITEHDVDAFLASPEAQKLQSTEYRTIHIRIPFSDDYNRITESEKNTAMQIAQQTQELLKSSNDAQAILNQLTTGIAKNYVAPVQGGDMGYHPAAGLPTDIAKQITPLEVGQVTAPQITPEGIDVVKLVDKRNSDNMIIPQWKVRHILVKTDERNNDALVEQRVNDLYEQLRRDADFASLAATYSDDPGSAGRGGDLDWVTEGQMVPEFEEMMKRTPEGDFSTPFKSQFGWHILKVEGVREKDVSDTIKRNLAREALFQRLAPQAQEDWLQELRANAYVKIFN